MPTEKSGYGRGGPLKRNRSDINFLLHHGCGTISQRIDDPPPIRVASVPTGLHQRAVGHGSRGGPWDPVDGQYGFNDLYLGVPIVIGAGGVEKIVAIELSADEKAMLDKSAAAVREVIEAGKKL